MKFNTRFNRVNRRKFESDYSADDFYSADDYTYTPFDDDYTLEDHLDSADFVDDMIDACAKSWNKFFKKQRFTNNQAKMSYLSGLLNNRKALLDLAKSIVKYDDEYVNMDWPEVQEAAADSLKYDVASTLRKLGVDVELDDDDYDPFDPIDESCKLEARIRRLERLLKV